MTDYNILYISTGNYGAPAGRLLPLMQGQFGQVIPLEIRNLDGSIPDLTGYTFAATKRQGSTVTAWVGSIVLSGTPAAAPQAMMTVDEDDTGQGGAGPFFLEMTNGTQVLKTHPVSLTITPDPAVNDTPAAGLVSVTTAQKALLATIAELTGLVEMAAGSATGVAIQTFMRTFLGSANEGAARAAIGAAALGANTFTGAQTLADQLLIRPFIKDYGETVNPLGNVTGTMTIDLENGNYATATLTGAVTVLAINNWPATGTLGSLTLELAPAGNTVIWTGVTWVGAEPTLGSTVDFVVLWSHTAGATIYAAAPGATA